MLSNSPPNRKGGFFLPCSAEAAPGRSILHVMQDAELRRVLDRFHQSKLIFEGRKENIAFNPVTIESPGIGGSLTGAFYRDENTVSAAFKLFASD